MALWYLHTLKGLWMKRLAVFLFFYWVLLLCLWFSLFEFSGFLVRFLSCHVMDVSAHETNTHVKLEMDYMCGLGCIIWPKCYSTFKSFFCKVCQTWHLFHYGITFSYSIQIFCGQSLFSMDFIELISAYLTQCLSLEFPASSKKHHSHYKKNNSFFFFEMRLFELQWAT